MVRIRERAGRPIPVDSDVRSPLPVRARADHDDRPNAVSDVFVESPREQRPPPEVLIGWVERRMG